MLTIKKILFVFDYITLLLVCFNFIKKKLLTNLIKPTLRNFDFDFGHVKNIYDGDF